MGMRIPYVLLSPDDLAWHFPDGASLPACFASQLVGATWLGKRASALAVDGYNLVANGESWTGGPPPTGWTENNGATSATVDSAADLGTSSGGTDSLVVKVTQGGANGSLRQGVSTIIGATFRYGCLSYSPSANMDNRVARLYVGASGSNAAPSSEDIWASLTVTFVATVTSGHYHGLTLLGSTLGDVGYFDSAYAQLMLAPFVSPPRSPNGSVYAKVISPASGVTPRSLWFRSTDALNGWEVRVLPNTAGNDLFLYERVSGVFTGRIAADVDWTSNGTDEVAVTFVGPVVNLYHRKAGAYTWTLAGSYAGATFNQNEKRHGIIGWGTVTDAFAEVRISNRMVLP